MEYATKEIRKYVLEVIISGILLWKLNEKFTHDTTYRQLVRKVSGIYPLNPFLTGPDTSIMCRYMYVFFLYKLIQFYHATHSNLFK